MNFIKGNAKVEEKQPKMKTLSLTDEEKKFLQQRVAVKNQYEYIAHLVEQEMQDYVDLKVRKRLNLSHDVVPHIDEEKGVIHVPQQVDSPKQSDEGATPDK